MTANAAIIPLGGYGEVGKNCTLIAAGEDLLLLDAGLMFPDNDMPGVDVVIPDFTYLLENRHRLRGIILTHGHEDHIGALPHLLPHVDVPVYATRLTHGLLGTKLREHGLTIDRRIIEAGQRFSLGKVEVESFHVNHSIPDCVGYALRTAAGTIVHTGDFKFDQTPVDGISTDYGRLAALGEEGVLALICDCVRVERTGITPSERVVAESLDRIFAESSGRLIVTQFASNITRIQQILYTAYRYDRKVAIVGRSLENNLSVARELGFLDVPANTLVSVERAGRMPSSEVALIVTGSQGEPSSVLSRIAHDDHKQVKVGAGDTVVISASPIPGNEQMVFRTIDGLFRLGADVIYDSPQRVHVSGHASQDELRMMINLVRPRYCLPFHGDFRHMVMFRRLAEEMGFAPHAVMTTEVGRPVQLSSELASCGPPVASGSVLVDGLTLGEGGQALLRDRRLLAREGVMMVGVLVDKTDGSLLSDPEITSKGFFYENEADAVLLEARERIRSSLAYERDINVEPGYVAQKVKEVLGKLVYERTKRRPMIMPVVIEI